MNERPAGSPRGSCKERGGDAVRARFKSLVAERCPGAEVRASASLCLDQCELGAVAVVYPDGVWYKGVRPEDVEEIVQGHLVGGAPVERLRVTEKDLAWVRECRRAGRVPPPRPVPRDEPGAGTSGEGA